MDSELICKLIEYLNSLPDGTETTTMDAVTTVIENVPENMILITLDAELRKEASRSKLVLDPVYKKPIYTGQPFKEPYIVQHINQYTLQNILLKKSRILSAPPRWLRNS